MLEPRPGDNNIRLNLFLTIAITVLAIILATEIVLFVAFFRIQHPGV